MNSRQRGTIALCLLVLGAGHLAAHSRERVTDGATAPGERYKEDLIAVINRSERIVVVEHAFESGPGGEVDLEHQRVYASKELDRKQKTKFLASIKSMDARVADTSEEAAECAFEPHHAIQFYDAAGWPLGTIEASFECGVVFWEGSHGDVPAALAGTLERLVSSVGLTARRDWGAVQKAAP